MANGAQGHTVLMIEDDKSICKVTTLRLEKEGYRVVVTPSGEEGLKLAKSEAPHVILLDLMLPKMDGREVRRRLQDDPATRHIPVILFTVLTASELGVMSEQGEAMHVLKPYQAHELLSKVRQAIERGAQQGPSGS
jgi:CheY-like chemotaxis protein